MISMIWAMDENWLIGKDNLLPWHYPKDLSYFKKQTKDKAVLMGDATYRSLKQYFVKTPLPFKKNYVANIEKKDYLDAQHVRDLFAFLENRKEDLIIIGGKTIYELALPYTQRLYITYILKTHKGNVYFPKFDLSKFKLVDKKMCNAMIFAVYERINI